MIMSESKRISNLYQSIYNGNPWLEVTLANTLKDVSAEQAYRKINPNLNTIWEIVNHLIQWRRNILRRVQGETVTTPDHNYFVPVLDPSEAPGSNHFKIWQNHKNHGMLFLKILMMRILKKYM